MQLAPLKQTQIANISAKSLQVALNTDITHYNLFYLIENPHFDDSDTGVVLKRIPTKRYFKIILNLFILNDFLLQNTIFSLN